MTVSLEWKKDCHMTARDHQQCGFITENQIIGLSHSTIRGKGMLTVQISPKSLDRLEKTANVIFLLVPPIKTKIASSSSSFDGELVDHLGGWTKTSWCLFSAVLRANKEA